MTPVAARDNLPDLSLRNSELSRERPLGIPRRWVALSDIANLLFGQFRISVTLPTWLHFPRIPSSAGNIFRAQPGPVPAAFNHLPGVVSGRAWMEVARVAARRVVAAMEDHWSVDRYRATGQDEREPVRAHGYSRLAFSGPMKYSISAHVPTSYPWPTG
jgi:hypothetical protein